MTYQMTFEDLMQDEANEETYENFLATVPQQLTFADLRVQNQRERLQAIRDQISKDLGSMEKARERGKRQAQNAREKARQERIASIKAKAIVALVYGTPIVLAVAALAAS